jgi:hypothetical protein
MTALEAVDILEGSAVKAVAAGRPGAEALPSRAEADPRMSARTPTSAPEGTGVPPLGTGPGAADRIDDLAQIIRAYNRVTENLQASHEALRTQVAGLQ